MVQTIFIAFAIGYILGIVTFLALTWLAIRVMEKARIDYEKELQKQKKRTKDEIRV